MAGAGLALLGNILHPRPDNLDSVQSELQMVAGSEIWLLDHFILGWSIALLFIGLLAVTSYLDAGGSTLPRLARAAIVGGATVAHITVAVDGFALKHAADAWAGGAAEGASAGAEGVAWVSLALFTALIGSWTGLTPVLVGLAQLTSGRFPARLGYLGIAGGALGMLVATIQFLSGPSELVTNVIFTIAAIIVTVWAFLSGLHLWRAGARTPPAAADAAL